MAIPAYVGANIIAATSTFGAWLDRTNQISTDLATIVVSTAANSTGGLTTGNAYVNGVFSSNTLTAIAGIRGGTVSAPANLNILSDTVTSANVYLNGLTNFNSGVFIVNSSGIFSNTLVVLGGSNTFVNASALNINSVTTVNGVVTFNANVVSNANVAVNGTTTLNTAVVNGVTSLNANVTANSNVTVNGNTTFNANVVSNANVTVNAVTTLNTVSVTGTTTLNTAVVNGTAAFNANVTANSNVTVNGNTTLNTAIISIITGGTANINANTLNVRSNTSYTNTVYFTNTVNFQAGTFVNANGDLVVGGITTLGTVIVNIITGGTANINANTLNVRSNTLFTNTVSFSNTVNLPASSYINGNGDLIISGNAQVNNITVLNGFGGVINAVANNSLNLNGQPQSFYTNATNISTGTLNDARLPTTMANKSLTAPIFKAYAESVYSNTAVNANLILDLAQFNIFNLTLTANNVTLTMQNPYASGNGVTATVIITQDATGGRVATIAGRNAANTGAGAIRYPFGSVPTLSTGGSKTDILSFVTYDGGTNYFGSLNLANT